MSGRLTLPNRLPAVLALAATAALASACGAGAHNPQYKETATITGVDADLPGGLVIGNAYVTQPAPKGGTATVVFSLGILYGQGGSITSVTSPLSQDVTLQSVDPAGKLAPADAASVVADGSQTPHVFVARLKSLTADLPPASFASVTFGVAGQDSTTLSLPVIRPGALALGPGGVPLAVLDHPSQAVAADTSEANPASEAPASTTP
ncbi:MAG TPA: hypothetical protein VHE83_01810 [Mycobacteriales bacterium]|nr:hypothetical protein [Mycobacteriales bacterium]